jgi:hypothetical protein
LVHYTPAGYVSLAADREGAVGIAYYDAANRDLKYARASGSSSSFTVMTVDASGTVGEHPSLAFDSSGRPHRQRMRRRDDAG